MVDESLRSEAPSSGAPSTSQLVLAAGGVMVLTHLAFRAWSLYPSWFFTDDYRLMLDARGRSLSWGYLKDPFDSQFMPLGRLEVWVVAHAGTTNWHLAATVTLAFTAVAALACLWMLVTLFGPRPGVLVPLALYLTSAVTLPGFMWWAAALNQLPLQVSVFLAVGCWIRYLRGDGTRWLWLTVAAVLFGLTAYVKALLVLPVLAALAVGWFTTGSPRSRLRTSLHRWWRVLPLTIPFVAFALYYAIAVPQPFDNAGKYAGQQAAGAADGMLATSLPTGVLGGPWLWFRTSPPTVLADPPGWTVHVAWVVVAALVVYAALRRRRTAWAWGLLAGYAVVAYALLAVSRGQLFGRVAGLEYRYLTDVMPVVVLALSLAFLELRGAPGASGPREAPLLTSAAPRRVVAGLLLVVVVGGLASSWQYVNFWHNENAGRSYVRNLQGQLGALGPVDLADGPMPPAVMPDYTEPENRTGVFVPLVSSQARFPDVSDDLHVVASDGSVQPADVDDGIESLPGPEPDCGWKVQRGRVDVPLEEPSFDFTWWIEIGYLGSKDDTLSIQVAGETFQSPVHQGLHTLFVKVTGIVDGVALGGLESGTVCVDTIEVGGVTPKES